MKAFIKRKPHTNSQEKKKKEKEESLKTTVKSVAIKRLTRHTHTQRFCGKKFTGFFFSIYFYMQVFLPFFFF